MNHKALTTLLAACLAGVALTAGGALARPDANSATYSDPAGDSGTAPDFVGVTVANDDAGIITFRVAFANRGTFDSDDEAGLVLDADGDSRTGAGSGFEYVLAVTADGPRLLRFDDEAEEWTAAAPQPAVRFGWEADGFTLAVPRQSLASTFGFRFYGLSWDTEEEEPFDEAPDGTEVWSYALRLPFGLTAAAAETPYDLTDRAPRAGKAYVLAALVRRTDTGETVGAGRIRCTARLPGSKALKVVQRRFFVIMVVPGGSRTQAICSWSIPRSARGRRLTATIAVTVAGKTASRTTTAIVR